MKKDNWVNEQDTKNPKTPSINPIMEGMPNNQWQPVAEDPVQYRDQQRRGLQFVMGFIRTGGGPLGKFCSIYQKSDEGDFVIVSVTKDNPNDIRVFEMTNEYYGDPNPDPTDMVRRVLEMADGSGMNRDPSQYGDFGKILETASLEGKLGYDDTALKNIDMHRNEMMSKAGNTNSPISDIAAKSPKAAKAVATGTQSIMEPLAPGIVGNTQTGQMQRAHPLAEKMMGAFKNLGVGLTKKVFGLRAGQQSELTAGQVGGALAGGAKQAQKKGQKEIQTFDKAYAKRMGFETKYAIENEKNASRERIAQTLAGSRENTMRYATDVKEQIAQRNNMAKDSLAARTTFGKEMQERVKAQTVKDVTKMKTKSAETIAKEKIGLVRDIEGQPKQSPPGSGKVVGGPVAGANTTIGKKTAPQVNMSIGTNNVYSQTPAPPPTTPAVTGAVQKRTVKTKVGVTPMVAPKNYSNPFTPKQNTGMMK